MNSYQNVGIATSAALGMFDNPKDIAQALAVPLCYGIIEAVVLGIYCLAAWKLGWTKAPREEKFCVVLTKTFEIEDTEGENESMASIEDQDVIESMDMVCSMDRTKTSDSEIEEGKGASRDRFESTELTVASTLSDLGDTSRSSSKRSTASTQVIQQEYHASGIPRPSRQCISPRQVPYHDMHDDDAFDCSSLSPIHSDKELIERSVCDEANDNNEDLDVSNSINDQPHASLTPNSLHSRVNHSSSFQSCIEVSLTKSHSSQSSHSSLTPKSLNSRVNHSSSFQSCIEVSLTKSHSSNSQDRGGQNKTLSSRSKSNDSDASQLLMAASIDMSEGQTSTKSQHPSKSQDSDKHSAHPSTELSARSPSHASCPPELPFVNKDQSGDDIFSYGAHSV